MKWVIKLWFHVFTNFDEKVCQGFKCIVCVHKSEKKVIRLVTKRGFACSQDYRIQDHFLKSFIWSGSAVRQSYYIESSKKEEGIYYSGATAQRRCSTNKLTSLPMYGFIARLVELLSNCLNWKIYCYDHSALSSTTAVQIWIISYKLHIISLYDELNKSSGFIAQLVEHRTGIAEVRGSNPVEALIFSGFFFPIA